MAKLSVIACAVALLSTISVVHAQPDSKLAANQHTAAINATTRAQQLDTLAQRYYRADAPGATMIVVQDGKILLRKAYGLANIETKEKLTPDHVMRLGSITKQFTAVAIMQLVEQGKIGLSDPITNYFPDFPRAAQKITVEHLLTHTSGIPSYTGKPDFFSTMGQDKTVAQMLDSFKNDPLEFEPGSAYKYNNSGYFLLGALIEKVSGESYANYIAQHVFKPLDMQHSAYEGHAKKTYPRALAHSNQAGVFVPSQTISMTIPYAAGALTSNVDDLAKWNAAVQAKKLLSAASWTRMFTPFKLNNGQSTGYGYGWIIDQFEGRSMISHAGGIPGFVTNALWLPQEKLYVAVLSNADGGLPNSEMISMRLASAVIGVPIPEYKTIKLDEKLLDQYVGVYKIDDSNRRYIVREGDKLVMTRTNGPRTELLPYSQNGFYRDENTLIDVEFKRDASGQVNELVVHQRGAKTSHPKTNETPPKAPSYYAMNADEFDAYVGEYELMPNFIISIKRDGERFIARATGQPEIQIFPLSRESFDVPIIQGSVKFEKDAQGKVRQLILTQNGQAMPAQKIK